MNKVKRQWGHYEVLVDEKDYKVKRLTVKPHGMTSIQKHENRDEYWFVLSGGGVVKNRDDYYNIHIHSQVFIRKNEVHQIINNTNEPLVILETWVGESSEEDIIRYDN